MVSIAGTSTTGSWLCVGSGIFIRILVCEHVRSHALDSHLGVWRNRNYGSSRDERNSIRTFILRQREQNHHALEQMHIEVNVFLVFTLIY